MNNRLHKWMVVHPTLGTAEVEARDPLEAKVNAAKQWGERWTQIDKDCTAWKAGSIKKKGGAG